MKNRRSFIRQAGFTCWYFYTRFSSSDQRAYGSFWQENGACGGQN